MKYSPREMVEVAVAAGYAVDTSPTTGNPRLAGANDVMYVVDILGELSAAADKLGVEEIEIEHWADDYYVPTRYAERIKDLTGWSVWSIQCPPFDGTASANGAQ